MKPLSRRRFLYVCAAAAGLAALPFVPVSLNDRNKGIHYWSGILMGADVQLTLVHPDKAHAQHIFEKAVQEIQLLESIFTLYDSHSQLSLLNRNGVLRDPAPEMIDILNLSAQYHQLTQGAFDITVKSLEDGRSSAYTGMEKLIVEKDVVFFQKKHMAITLNGIAQGYITDAVTAMLRHEGLQNILVELGEKRALGQHPSGRPWTLQLQGTKKAVSLKDTALATSARLNGDTGKPHIYEPSSGLYAEKHDIVSVVAKTAAMADALSTGFMSLDSATIKTIVNNNPEIVSVYT